MMAAESEVLVPAIKDTEKEKDTSKSPEATMNVTPTHLEADTPLKADMQMQYFKVTPHQQIVSQVKQDVYTEVFGNVYQR